MVARVLAVVAAVAMIVGAVAYRSSRDSSSTVSAGSPDVRLGVVCASELGAVCDALSGATVEPAAVTADRLLGARSAAEGGVAAWLAPGPWAAMVDAGRRTAALPKLFEGRGEVLGRTELVAVVRKGQTPSACVGAAVSWKCLGDAAQEPSFRIGGDPADHAIGLFVRAAALSGFIGNTTFGSNDIEDAAAGWLANVDARLDAAPGFGATSLQQFLVTPGSARAYLTTGAAAATSPSPGVDVVTPTPAAGIEVVLARTTEDGGDVSVAKVTSALRQAKWDAGRLSGDDGLPSPGVLLALREVVG